MQHKYCQSYPISIFMAGDCEAAKKLCRFYCDEVGFCVTVTPTSYIYTDGQEDGFVVGLINYPRFPLDPSELWARALSIADTLRVSLGQDSYSIQAPDKTLWQSWRAA
jgi:hypothetical protein